MSLQEAKDYLQITANTFDNLLNMLIDQASDMVEVYCNRKFALKVREELYTGDGTFSLMLDAYPVVDVYYLTQDINKDTKTTNNLIAPNKYLVQPDTGILELYDDIFWMAFGQYQGFYSGIYNSLYNRNIYIKYLAGYATIPASVKSVVLDVVSKKFYDIRDKRFGVNSKASNGESISFSDSDLSKGNKASLSRFRRIGALRGMTVSGYGVQS